MDAKWMRRAELLWAKKRSTKFSGLNIGFKHEILLSTLEKKKWEAEKQFEDKNNSEFLNYGSGRVVKRNP